MRYNWDNKNNIILHWYPAAGGEFISRCLSMSKRIIMISSLEQINAQLSKPADYGYKFKIFSGQSPVQDLYWHKNFIDSRQWLAAWGEHDEDPQSEGMFAEGIFANAHQTNREFYDQFWRPISCIISNLDYGIVLKSHKVNEAEGMKHLMPTAKIVTIEDADMWTNKCLDKVSEKVHKVFYSGLGYQRSKIPETIKPIRLRFDEMISNHDSFMTQMDVCYMKLGFDDFNQCKDHLYQMWKIYRDWNLKWLTKG